MMKLSMIISMTILLTSLTVTVGAQDPVDPPDPNVPFTYDPNLCADPNIMDWAFSEPGVTVIYSVSFYTKSGRPASALAVGQSNGSPLGNVAIQYRGKFKLDPNTPGWSHTWAISWTPTIQEVQHINIRAFYSKRSKTDAWEIPPGQWESDEKTILLKVTDGDRPYLQPGPPPSSLIIGQQHLQWRWKHYPRQFEHLQTFASATRVWR